MNRLDTPHSPSSLLPHSHPHPHPQGEPQVVTDPFTMPTLGLNRCYWTILSPTLDFLFVDPIFQHHLGPESTKFVGTNLLTYVHPDEQESLARDLSPTSPSGGIQGGGVFGSVTK